MKKVKRQPNMKLRDIQDAIHEKYTINISLGKSSKTRSKAQGYVDRAYTQQYNQLWEYCEELRRFSPSSTILMKVHIFNEGDLAAEMDLVYWVPYFESNNRLVRIESNNLFGCLSNSFTHSHTLNIMADFESNRGDENNLNNEDFHDHQPIRTLRD